MIFYSTVRIIKFAVQNIWRNLGLSFMTVTILIVTLLSFNVFIAMSAMTRHAVETVKDKIDASVYFAPAAADAQVQEVQEFLRTFPEVKELTLKTRDEALAQFREKHKNNPDVMASLDELEGNPFGPTLVITTHEPGQYETVLKALTTPDLQKIIEGKTFDNNEGFIQRLQLITRRVEQFVLGITALFLLIAFLIIFNTIRVAIYTQREEISIKKLVGATNWFIRAPFLLDGVAYTLVSVGVAVALVFGILGFVDEYIQAVFTASFSLIAYFRANSLIFVYEIAAVLFLTWLSSALAMRKYLRA
ncbi:MAG: permease-like cell division protein FtsX [Patescibacteria group bacterium]